MNWLGRMLNAVRKSYTPSSLDLFRELFRGRMTKSGKVVDHKTALDVSVVLACARVYALGWAQVPFKIFRDQGRSKLPAPDHSLHKLLSLRPNQLQTAFEFFETVAYHVVLTGNAFVFMNYVRGQLYELLPLDPGTVTVKCSDDWTVSYDVRIGGKTVTFSSKQIWQIKGAGWATWLGLDAVHLARDAIGLAIATEETHASLHKNGVRSSGSLTVEGTLTDTQYKQLQGWVESWKGSENAGIVRIMDRNAKWLSDTLTGVDSQHLETRRYQVEEVCRHMGVMPIMVGHADKAATYASAEQMFLANVVYTLAPWYRRMELSISAHLLSDKDVAAGYYPKFVIQGLLRGAIKDTSEYLNKLVAGGIMTPNEAREVLELNPLEGHDELRVPANIVGAPKDPAPEPEPVGA